MQYSEKVKREIETKAERCARIEEQTKRASEEAARKYQEYLKAHPEYVEPELKRPIVTVDTQQESEQHERTAAELKQRAEMEKQTNRRNGLFVEHSGETFYTSSIPVHTSHINTLIVPPVAASNQRAISYEQKRRAAKEYAEHYAENRERDVQRSIREANDKAKKAFANMSEEELRQYTEDMVAIKLGNEQRMQKQTPKAIREHQMSPEAYARHVEKQKKKQKDPEYKAKLQQQKKDRHITHGKTTVIPLAPMPTIDGPLKPPCNPIKIPESQNTTHTVQQKMQRQYERIMLAKQEALLVKLDTLQVFKRLFVILAILQHFNINTIGDLVKWDVRSIHGYCKFYNTEFTTEDFFAIRKELKEKYDITWRKPNGLKEESKT